jgi:hypothetical protein
VLWVNGRLIGATLPHSFFKVHLNPGKQLLVDSGIDNGWLALETRPGGLFHPASGLFRTFPLRDGCARASQAGNARLLQFAGKQAPRPAPLASIAEFRDNYRFPASSRAPRSGYRHESRRTPGIYRNISGLQLRKQMADALDHG